MSEPTDREELSPEEGGDVDPNEVELAWAAEIQDRIADVREGRVKGIPSDELFAGLRAMIADAKR